MFEKFLKNTSDFNAITFDEILDIFFEHLATTNEKLINNNLLTFKLKGMKLLFSKEQNTILFLIIELWVLINDFIVEVEKYFEFKAVSTRKKTG